MVYYTIFVTLKLKTAQKPHTVWPLGPKSLQIWVLRAFSRVIVRIVMVVTVDGQNPALPIIRNIP